MKVPSKSLSKHPNVPFPGISRGLRAIVTDSCWELVIERPNAVHGGAGTIPKSGPSPPAAPLLSVIVLTEVEGWGVRGFTWGKALPIMSGRLGI